MDLSLLPMEGLLKRQKLMGSEKEGPDLGIDSGPTPGQGSQGRTGSKNTRYVPTIVCLLGPYTGARFSPSRWI